MNIYETIKDSLNEGTSNSRFVELDKKSVEDSDGFMTDYTLYHDTENNKYVTVFGDSDLYRPEEENFDMEFETEKEAKEWFDSYKGFADISEGESKETLESIESLKSKLADLADRDFYHEMKDHWTHEDFELSDKLHKDIQEVISKLAAQGIDATYKLGYPIEYSDEIKKEEEEKALSNDDWFKLHESEIKELDATDPLLNKTPEGNTND